MRTRAPDGMWCGPLHHTNNVCRKRYGVPVNDFGGPLGPIQPRRSGRLGDTVVTYLVDRIVAGEYEVDSALPTEPELCEEFGVSRTVVRESIKLLEEKGLVRATPGRGTRVLES